MRLIDAEELLNILQEQQKLGNVNDSRGRAKAILEVIHSPTIEAEPVKHGRWLIREKDKLVATGKIAVSEGHILHKTSLDKPFTMLSANLIQIKKHRTVKKPYCSICGNYGDDEYDKTPYCPCCGARMDGDTNA